MIGGLFCYKTPPMYQMNLFSEGPRLSENSVVLVLEEGDYDHVVVLSPLGSHTIMKRYLVSCSASNPEIS